MNNIAYKILLFFLISIAAVSATAEDTDSADQEQIAAADEASIRRMLPYK